MEELTITDELVSLRINARETAKHVTSEQPNKYKRAERQDEHLRKAFQRDAAVRIILLDGDMAAIGKPQRVHIRELDPAAWRVESYDRETGAAYLYRGQKPLALAS